MNPLFQLSTRKYDQEIPLVKKAMRELEIKCGTKNGYEISSPSSMAGWTFFNIQLSQEMASTIEDSGMMEGALGYRIGEQLMNFLGHFLESFGSQVKIKQINY